MMDVRVLKLPDDYRDNHDQQYDPKQQQPWRRVVAHSDLSDARPRTPIDPLRSVADRLWTRCRGATHRWRFALATIGKSTHPFIWFSMSGQKQNVGDRSARSTGSQLQ
jgi:hypothetical protein